MQKEESDHFESVCAHAFEVPHTTPTSISNCQQQHHCQLSTASLERNDQDVTSTLGGEQNIQQNVPFDLPLNMSATDINTGNVFHNQDPNASPLQPNPASTEDPPCMPMSNDMDETTDEEFFRQPISSNQAVVNASEFGKTISAKPLENHFSKLNGFSPPPSSLPPAAIKQI